MIVYLDYCLTEGYWFYYFYTKGNFRTKVEGFKNHIVAKEHAYVNYGNDIKILNK